MPTLQAGDLGSARAEPKAVDNLALLAANEATRSHPIEAIGHTLRGYMKDMKRIAVGG
ncbi:Ketol-acid reductoisomerase [compost metagenome]